LQAITPRPMITGAFESFLIDSLKQLSLTWSWAAALLGQIYFRWMTKSLNA